MLSALFRRHPAPAAPTAPAEPAPTPVEPPPSSAGPAPSAAAPAAEPAPPASADGPPVWETEGVTDAAAWAAGQRETLRRLVAEHGALTVRGLGLRTPADVASVLRGVAGRPVTEREAFAERTPHTAGVYSSSAWPPNQPMCMHHELSYAVECPGLLLFACLVPPDAGGATAVADAAAVLRALPAGTAGRFEREGWLLTRTYNGEIGATLGQSFGTDDRAAVEAYCRAHAIDFAWQPDGSLRTRQHRRAVVRHPVTGRRCWFNQIAFLNEWTMAPEVREFLVAEYGPDALPFNTRYGDGDPVPREVVEEIAAVYDAHTVRRPWRAGDLLLVDNIATAHSREAYEGPREVVVALADPVRLDPPHAGPPNGRTTP